MKVYKPGTDCEVEFTILANGKKCPEFTRPEDDEGDSVAKVCYIPIADGDTITMDVDAGRLDVDLSDAVIAERVAAYVPPEAVDCTGVLAKYAKLVSSATEGAVTLV